MLTSNRGLTAACSLVAAWLLQVLPQARADSAPRGSFFQSLAWFHNDPYQHKSDGYPDYPLQQKFAAVQIPINSGFIVCETCEASGIAVRPLGWFWPRSVGIDTLTKVNEQVLYWCKTSTPDGVYAGYMEECLADASLVRQNTATLGTYRLEYYLNSDEEIDRNSSNSILVATADVHIVADLAPAAGPVSVVGPSDITLQLCDTCFTAMNHVTDVSFDLSNFIRLNSGDATPIVAMSISFETDGPLFMFARPDSAVSWSKGYSTVTGAARAGSCTVGEYTIAMRNAAAPTMWRYPVNTVDLYGVATLEAYAACLRVLDVFVDPSASALSPDIVSTLSINITAAGDGRNYETSFVTQLHISQGDKTEALPPPPVSQIAPAVDIAACHAVPLADIFQLASSPGTASYVTRMTLSIDTADAGVVLYVAVDAGAHAVMSGYRMPVFDMDTYATTTPPMSMHGKYFNKPEDMYLNGLPAFYQGWGATTQAHAISVSATCGSNTTLLSYCQLEFTAYAALPTVEEIQTALRLLEVHVYAPCRPEPYTLRASMKVWQGPVWENNVVTTSSMVAAHVPCSPPSCTPRAPLPSPSSQPFDGMSQSQLPYASSGARSSTAAASSLFTASTVLLLMWAAIH